MPGRWGVPVRVVPAGLAGPACALLVRRGTPVVRVEGSVCLMVAGVVWWCVPLCVLWRVNGAGCRLRTLHLWLSAWGSGWYPAVAIMTSRARRRLSV